MVKAENVALVLGGLAGLGVLAYLVSAKPPTQITCPSGQPYSIGTAEGHTYCCSESQILCLPNPPIHDSYCEACGCSRKI